MKTRKSFLNNNFATALVAVGFLLVVGLACGSTTPPPAQYVGVWSSSDGAALTIRADGSGDYKSGGTSVTNGSVTVDESAKTLKVSLAGLGPTFKIDKAPTDTEMTLDGVAFKKAGSTGSSSNSTKNVTSDTDRSVPADDKLQALAKETFSDFSDAIQDRDFTDFHGKIATVWQKDSTPEELNDAFKPFIDNKENYNFKKALASQTAVFTPAPTFEKVAGLDALVLRGNYPTKPELTTFELKYVEEGSEWKLVGINVRTKPGQ